VEAVKYGIEVKCDRAWLSHAIFCLASYFGDYGLRGCEGSWAYSGRFCYYSSPAKRATLINVSFFTRDS